MSNKKNKEELSNYLERIHQKLDFFLPTSDLKNSMITSLLGWGGALVEESEKMNPDAEPSIAYARMGIIISLVNILYNAQLKQPEIDDLTFSTMKDEEKFIYILKNLIINSQDQIGIKEIIWKE